MKIAKIVFGVAVLGTSAGAQAADLMQVYQQARANDAQFAAAQQEYKALREARPLARSSLLPQVNLSANVAQNYSRFENFSIAGQRVPNSTYDYGSNGYSLSLSQTLFNYSDWLALKQADQTVAAAQARLDAASQALILNTAQAYFSVLAAEDQLRYSRAQLRAIGRQLEQAKKRYDVGLVAVTDVQQAQASYDLARAAVIQAQSKVDNAREALAVLTGQEGEPLDPLARELPLLTPKPDNLHDWVQAAMQQNLSVVAARYATAAARREVGVQRAGHYPTVNLVASRAYNDSNAGLEAGRTTNDSIALQLNVPLFSGLRVSSLTDQAQYKYLQANELLKGQQREAVRQTRSAYLNVMSSISQVEALRQAVASNEASVASMEAGFKVGTRTSLDVLSALSDLYKAQSEYAQARYNYLVNTLLLKQAAGTLSMVDIEHINGYLTAPSAAAAQAGAS
ncbi:hypothetical protein BI364_00435 [Acidihalobacter yilgarnensis]|uniref:Uncharacterized protein n=1 Tax=Acidihalobacter yilgarnensis TaxID=2819280 RepID=A0A1D8IJM6_9GAMM|nr:TolC family outer membrane protein [Acidihalobacter yilgarnensis]AOU96688.1 hypothetical protein BI364_00435 [Acidihalobacter yilgarnensis]